MRPRHFRFPVMMLTGLLLAAMGGTAQPSGIAELDDRGITLRIDRDDIAVSGISSGAAMAHQLHITHSAGLKGVGMVAGPPYRCAEMMVGNPLWAAYSVVDVAVAICTHAYLDFPLPLQARLIPLAANDVDPARTEDLTQAAFDRTPQVTDDWTHLCDDRVFLVAGSEDKTVPKDATDATAALYRWIDDKCRSENGDPLEGMQVVTREGMPHTMPVELNPSAPGACPSGPPYISDCDYLAGAEFLTFLHPDRATAAPAPGTVRADPDNLIRFNQHAVIGATTPKGLLHEHGYLYVPERCQNPADGEACPLHIALHGCKQNEDMIGGGALFARDAGYNSTAERLGIVVLYPQVTSATVSNPNGCWDWWGYNGTDYYQKGTRQIRNLWTLVETVAGE